MAKTSTQWEQRSLQYKDDIRGVLFGKNYPTSVINSFDKWSFNLVKSSISNSATRVLDLGCGYGRVAKEIVKKNKRVSIYGIDLSKTYVSLFNKSLKGRGKAIAGTITKLPYKDNYFDYGFMIATLMYLPNKVDQKKAVDEIRRVLKNKSTFILIERTPLMQLLDIKNRLSSDKTDQISFSKDRIQALFQFDKVGIEKWPSRLLPLFLSYKISLVKEKRRDAFTEQFETDLTYDADSRAQKARKIAAVIRDYKGDTKKLTCLDVGSSTGLIAENLSKHFKKVIGVDVDQAAITSAKKRIKKTNVSFLLSEEATLPCKSNSIDVVVFNQVYEHTADPYAVMNEIRRVLKKGGICFLGARNKYGGPFDGHYSLPFLSWLPRPLSNVYLSLFTQKKEYDVNLLSLPELQKFAKGFKKTDYTLKVIEDPEKFEALDVLPKNAMVRQSLHLASFVLYDFIPNYIWILEK